MDEPLDVLREVIGTFDATGIEYMVVGSTAMRAYVPGRSTFDTDVLVKMTPGQLDRLKTAFGDAWYLDPITARRGLADQRMFNAIHFETSWKLDLIPLKGDEYHQSEFSRRRMLEILGIPCVVQSPEDLVLSKLHWARSGGSRRQVEDVRTLLTADLGLDIEYIRQWAEKLGVSKLLDEAAHG